MCVFVSVYMCFSKKKYEPDHHRFAGAGGVLRLGASGPIPDQKERDGRRDPGSPTKPEVFADWMLLFPLGRFHCYDDPDAAAVAGDATAVAVDTSTGESGYITFTLRHPSEVSYLDLHWPYGTPESVFDAFPANASAVGTHENLVLLSISLARMEYRIRPPDLFVYTFGPSSPPPSLRRLPACTATTKGFAGGRVFLMANTSVRILCVAAATQTTTWWQTSSCPGKKGAFPTSTTSPPTRLRCLPRSVHSPPRWGIGRPKRCLLRSRMARASSLTSGTATGWSPSPVVSCAG